MVDQGAAIRSSEGGVIVTEAMAGEVIVMQTAGMGLGNGHGMSSMKLRGSRGSEGTSGGASRFEDSEEEVMNGGGQHLEGRPSASSASIMDISPNSLFAFNPEQPNFFTHQKTRGSTENSTPSHTSRSLSVDSGIPSIFNFSHMESELSNMDSADDRDFSGMNGVGDYPSSHRHSHSHTQGVKGLGKPPRGGLFAPSSNGPAFNDNAGQQQFKRERTFGGFPSNEASDLLNMNGAHFHSAEGLPHPLPNAGGARPLMMKPNGGAPFAYSASGQQGGHPAAVYGMGGPTQQAGEGAGQERGVSPNGANGYLPTHEEAASAAAAAALYASAGMPNGVGLGANGPGGVGAPRVYFQGYDASGAMLAVAHPQAGGGLVTPTHFVTAAGMVPINQLMPFHMVRTLASPMGPGNAGVPLENAMAYAAGAGIPFFVQAAPHAHALNPRLYSDLREGSRDGSPSRPGSREEDWHYGGRRRHDGLMKGDLGGHLRGDKRGGGGAKKRVERDPDVLAALSGDSPSLEEILKSSSVHSLSQDQVGCRFLQLKLDESGAEAATVILSQAKPYLGDMMTDPFGNYLFQKILEKVSEGERTHILSHVQDQLVDAALNLHGTRSVQRLVELCKSEEQLSMIRQALRRDVVRLCVDANGNHVIQRALQHLSPEDRGFIFDAVSSACVEVSTHRHGCCVMQRCLDAATLEQRRVLVREVGNHCFQLMQDPYGNYVVQYVLDRCHGDEIRPVTSCPIGRIASLSVQKYSSNVVEKCLEKATEDIQCAYIDEMSLPGNIKHLMQDQYANYVVQRALSVASHGHGMKLVEAIRPHLHSMRNTAGGRRIVAKIVKRFPTVDLGNDFVNPR